jgi:hypothetical protein
VCSIERVGETGHYVLTQSLKPCQGFMLRGCQEARPCVWVFLGARLMTLDLYSVAPRALALQLSTVQLEVLFLHMNTASKLGPHRQTDCVAKLVVRPSTIDHRQFPIDPVLKILSRISVPGISMVSVVVVCCLLCSGKMARWTLPHEQPCYKLFYSSRPQLALLRSLLCSDR